MFGVDDAIIGAVGGSILTGFMNNSAASSRQSNAQDFSASQYAHRYQTSVGDLKAAGLNPMLAYGNGPGSSPQSSAASSAGTPDLGAAYNQAKMNSAQVANVEADTLNKRATAALIDKQIENTGASADEARSRISVNDASYKRIVEDIKNIPKEGDRLVALARQLGAQRDLMIKQGATQEQVTNQTRWLAVKAMGESDLVSLDVKAAMALDNVGRTTKELKPVLDVIRGILSESRR